MFDEKKIILSSSNATTEYITATALLFNNSDKRVVFYPHQNIGGVSFEITEKCPSAAPSEESRATKWQILKARQE